MLLQYAKFVNCLKHALPVSCVSLVSLLHRQLCRSPPPPYTHRLPPHTQLFELSQHSATTSNNVSPTRQYTLQHTATVGRPVPFPLNQCFHWAKMRTQTSPAHRHDTANRQCQSPPQYTACDAVQQVQGTSPVSRSWHHALTPHTQAPSHPLCTPYVGTSIHSSCVGPALNPNLQKCQSHHAIHAAARCL
jgi:hypothetical protein